MTEKRQSEKLDLLVLIFCLRLGETAADDWNVAAAASGTYVTFAAIHLHFLTSAVLAFF